MFSRLLLIFILLPLADLVLIWMFLAMHIGYTVLWIIVSGVAGAWYVRRQGVQVLAELRTSVDENKVPTDVIVEGGIVLFAGALLITPGLLTDLLGFSMLVRPCRRWYRRQLLAWLKKKVTIRTFEMTQPPGSTPSDVLDAKVVNRKNDDPTDSSRDSGNDSDPVLKSTGY